MFEVTQGDIAALSDSDLRGLVARLCEKSLVNAGLPVSAVNAGGDQRAKDGGLDVRVKLADLSKPLDFISRALTVFQVKQEKRGHPPSRIRKEMKPNDRLRPIFQELADASGAYIFVSGQDSTSASALDDRRSAMREAVDSIENSGRLHLDFLGGDRVAQWVNLYPGLIVWVLERTGRSTSGWKPFGSWASPNESPDAEYLIDGTARLYNASMRQESGAKVEDGLNRMREILAEPGSAIRFVGLSGLGKTRLVQALFDSRIGTAALDPADAVYSDVGDDPKPSPREMLVQLNQSQRRAVLVVDNCTPETHRALVKNLPRNNARSSLITVEYDVGEDEPEGTDVFRLGPASEKQIETLLGLKEPQVSLIDRGRIAEFSGGNAKLALALARTVEAGESVSNLTDKVLFERLFHQRQQRDTALLRAGEACSLVYSFDVETPDGPEAELPTLANLAGQSVPELYRNVSEMKCRGLVQQRGKWRAVLPHALANYMARRALENMPIEKVLNAFQKDGHHRLLNSFSRRLGYLHDCTQAQRIVSTWLSGGGFLLNYGSLSPIGFNVFQNVAPVLPIRVLDVIEVSIAGEHGAELLNLSHPYRDRTTSLLRSIAFEPELFARAVILLARFATAESEGDTRKSAMRELEALFHAVLSGTHATVEQRIEVIDRFISQPDAKMQAIGMIALSAMLRTGRFSSSHSFEFGARKRDIGWYPISVDDQTKWYAAVLRRVEDFVHKKTEHETQAKTLLAKEFRGLWCVAPIRSQLKAAMEIIRAGGFWSEGWIAVRSTIAFDGREMDEASLARFVSRHVV